ncbi:MAG TPA: hypothetical protein VFV03_01305 [Solirubrobacteraceae bacterium]|nr:hypothetical protein [Solirubrobacteraceae bacterium]
MTATRRKWTLGIVSAALFMVALLLPFRTLRAVDVALAAEQPASAKSPLGALVGDAV